MKIFVNGIEQQTADIKNFVIYGNGEILYKYDQFRIEQHEITENKNGEKQLSSGNRFISGEIVALHLAQPIKNARKENLTRKDNYFLNYTGGLYSWERGKTLYIHESEISVDDLGEILAMVESDGTRQFLHAVKLKFRNPVDVKKYHYERIPAGDDWTLPEGGRWSAAYGTEENPTFDTYDDTKLPEKLQQRRRAAGHQITKGVEKRWTTTDTENGNEAVVTFRYYTRTERSPERERLETIADRLNKSGVYTDPHEWSRYSVEKLEKALGYRLE